MYCAIQVRPPRSGNLPGLLPSEPLVRVPAAVVHVHVFPRLSHQSSGRSDRLRPARAGREIQEDGRNCHPPGNAQKLNRSPPN